MRWCLWIGMLVVATTGAVASATVITLGSSSSTLVVNNYSWSEDVTGVDLAVSETVSGPHATLDGSVSGDPLVWVRKDVENDTGFAWSAYEIDVTMPSSFTITQTSPMAGWTVSASPVMPVGAGEWGATILYNVAGGAMVQPNDWGEFDFQVSIPGTVQFTVDQTPIAPEPATLALLALGGLLIRRTRR